MRDKNTLVLLYGTGYLDDTLARSAFTAYSWFVNVLISTRDGEITIIIQCIDSILFILWINDYESESCRLPDHIRLQF